MTQSWNNLTGIGLAAAVDQGAIMSESKRMAGYLAAHKAYNDAYKAALALRVPQPKCSMGLDRGDVCIEDNGSLSIFRNCLNPADARKLTAWLNEWYGDEDE